MLTELKNNFDFREGGGVFVLLAIFVEFHQMFC